MDLFRRPGSQADLKVIMKKLSEGQEIALNDYNFYTLASVIKVPQNFFTADILSPVSQPCRISYGSLCT